METGKIIYYDEQERPSESKELYGGYGRVGNIRRRTQKNSLLPGDRKRIRCPFQQINFRILAAAEDE